MSAFLIIGTKLLLVFILSAAVGSEVMERYCSYSCSDLQLTFDPQCEHWWSSDLRNFAQASSTYECQHPCEWIKPGVMKLKECVSVNLTSVCFIDERSFLVKEEWTYYSPQPGSAAPPSAQVQGFFCLLLLKVLQLFLV